MTSGSATVQSEGKDWVVSSTRKNLEQSTVLLVILSPGYLASEWCRQEFDAFVQKIHSESDSSSPRIFVVEKTPVEKSEIPESLSNLPTTRFWTFDEAEGLCTLGIPKPNLEDVQYHQRVEELANTLADVLKEIRPERAPESKPVKPHPPLATVFLAEVTEDLANKREGVRRYLEQYNICVVPELLPSSSTLGEGDQPLGGLMEGAQLFVQLLSDRALTGTSTAKNANLAREQYKEARAKNIPILQWCSPQLQLHNVLDQSQKMLLELETVYAMNVEEFKPLIRQQLSKQSEVPAPPPSRFVYLNANEEDNRLAGTIGQILTQFGFVWRMRLNEGSPSVVRESLNANLRDCAALIVVYGEIHIEWVKQQLDNYRRAGRTDLKVFGLYDGPPKNKDDAPEAPGIQVLNCRDGLDEVKLRDFLSPLMEVGTT